MFLLICVFWFFYWIEVEYFLCFLFCIFWYVVLFLVIMGIFFLWFFSVFLFVVCYIFLYFIKIFFGNFYRNIILIKNISILFRVNKKIFFCIRMFCFFVLNLIILKIDLIMIKIELMYSVRISCCYGFFILRFFLVGCFKICLWNMIVVMMNMLKNIIWIVRLLSIIFLVCFMVFGVLVWVINFLFIYYLFVSLGGK